MLTSEDENETTEGRTAPKRLSNLLGKRRIRLLIGIAGVIVLLGAAFTIFEVTRPPALTLTAADGAVVIVNASGTGSGSLTVPSYTTASIGGPHGHLRALGLAVSCSGGNGSISYFYVYPGPVIISPVCYKGLSGDWEFAGPRPRNDPIGMPQRVVVHAAPGIRWHLMIVDPANSTGISAP